MRRLVVPAVTGALLAWGWVAAASYIYLWGVGKLTLYRFPFHQWLIIAPYWRLSWWVTLWVVAGAAVPTLLLLVCGVGMLRHRIKNRKVTRPVYGKTQWATPQEMASGNIVRKQRNA